MADSSTLVDRVKIFVESSGAGPFRLGNALPSFRGSEALVDGLTYSYAVESGSDYEVGRGVYVSAVDQLLREPTLSSNGGAPVSFPANVAVNFTALATDLVAGLAGSGTVTSVQASGGTTGLSFTGGPITGSGTLVLGGTLGVANGGTGGTNAVTAREAIGLGNVDNTSDADKPISTAVQAVFDTLGTVSTQDADDLNANVSVMQRPGFYNFRTSSFLRWSAALSAHRAGVSRALVACIGDSTMRGVGSNPDSAVADLIVRSWPSVLADALNQMPNTKATANSLWCDGFFTLVGPGNLAIADPRVSWEAGWQTHASMFVAGGRSFQYPDSASGTGRFNVDFTIGAAGPFEDDTCVVHYVKSPGFGDLLLTTNNASEFVASTFTSGADGVGALEGSRSAFFDTAWTVQRAAGIPDVNLIFFGIESYKAADKPIGIWNMGASGSRASNWVDDNQPYSFINVIQSLAPHLCVICLTINDWANDTAEATYKAEMQTIIDACAVNSDILLVVGVPSNVGTAPIDRQRAFAGYVRDLAVTNDLPVLDLSERWISQSLLPDRGLYYDGLHPSNVGYSDIGHMVAQIIGNPGYFFG